MALIIDGYNLLNVTSLGGRGGPGTSLQQARTALLEFLALRLSPRERRATTVVFDAGQAPPGLPRVVQQAGITVRYAHRHREADDLIEELIRRDTAPRRLTVVSSDHRLHRAARRRRARPIDSDVWFRQLLRRPPADSPPEPPKPAEDAEQLLSGEEVAQWLAAFAPEPGSPAAAPRSEWQAGTTAADLAAGDLANPFPPGYAEDLLEDEEAP